MQPYVLAAEKRRLVPLSDPSKESEAKQEWDGFLSARKPAADQASRMLFGHCGLSITRFRWRRKRWRLTPSSWSGTTSSGMKKGQGLTLNS